MSNKEFQGRHGVDVLGTTATGAQIGAGKGIFKLGGTILGSQPGASAAAYIPIGSSDGTNTYATWGTLEAADSSVVVEHTLDGKITLKATGTFTTATATDLTLSGTLAVNGGTLSSTATTFNFLTNVQNINIGSAQASGNTITIGTASNSSIYLKGASVELTSGKIILPVSSAAAPGIVVTGALTTGIFTTTSKVGISVAGTEYFSVTSTGTTTGTVTSGTWNGSVVAGQYGGTGVNNTGKTITLGGNLTTATAAITLTANAAGSSVTLPASGTLVNTAQTFYIGTTAITVTQASGSLTLPNSALTNSSVTVGTTAISLGSSATTINGVTSLDSQTIKRGVDTDSLTLQGGITYSGASGAASIRMFGPTHATNASQAYYNAVSHTFRAADGSATYVTVDSTGVVITGNLTVNGTTTTVNSTTIAVDDINLELGSVAVPTDVTANGGGITLHGATDKTITWDSTNANWTSSEHWNIATGKTFKINNTTVLSATQVLGKTIGGTSTGDIVSIDAVQTLTNKSLSNAGNIGINTTPKATVGKTIEFNAYHGTIGSLNGGPADHCFIGTNIYPTTSADPASTVWNAKFAARSTLFELGRGGTFSWYSTAAVGVADQPVTLTRTMILTYTGQFGVGATPVNATMAVGGASSFTASGTILEVKDSFRLFDSSSSSFGLNIGFTTNVPWIQAYRETVGAVNLQLQPQGGGVGVGASPTTGYKLDVFGDARVVNASASNAIKFKTDGSVDYSVIYLTPSDNTDTKYIIGYGPNHPSSANTLAIKNAVSGAIIALQTGTAGEYATIMGPTGDFGLGVSPTTKLDILVTDSTQSSKPRIQIDRNGENPILDLYRWTGNGTNYSGWRVENVNSVYTLSYGASANIGSQTWTDMWEIDSSGNIVHRNTTSSNTFSLTQGGAGTSTLMTFNTANHRSAELTVCITQGTNYEVVKLLVIYDGTDIHVMEYGRVGKATNVTFTASITTGTISVTATSTTTVATLKGNYTLIVV